MRKAFIIVIVVVMVALMAVPAFALSSGSGNLYYTPVRFDTFTTSESSVVHSWPFNNTQLGTSSASFSFGDGRVSGSASCLKNSSGKVYLSGYMNYPESAVSVGLPSSIILSTQTDQFVSRSLLDSFVIYFGSPFVLDSVRLSGSAYYVKSASDVGENTASYNLSFESFDRVFYETNSGDGAARVGLWLLECLDGLSHVGGDSWFFLNDVNVEIIFSRTDVSTPCFTISSLLTPNYEGTSGYQWFYNQGLTKTVVDGSQSIFDWLINSVEAFFDFQIAPGLSINKILYIVLVLGVLFLLLKLLM